MEPSKDAAPESRHSHESRSGSSMSKNTFHQVKKKDTNPEFSVDSHTYLRLYRVFGVREEAKYFFPLVNVCLELLYLNIQVLMFLCLFSQSSVS